jgi:hypothetical protein
MGWKSGLAALALCAGAAAGIVVGGPGAPSAVAVEPGAAFARFESRDYLLIWPSRPPSDVLVYFHAGDEQPLGLEARSGVLEALAADAAARNYAVIAPAAARIPCELPNEPPGQDGACWRLDAVAEQLGYVDRLIAQVEANGGVRFETRDAVGYGRGAALLVAALAEGRLDAYRKAGLLVAGPSAAPLPLAKATGPLIYLEAAEGDRPAAAAAGELLGELVASGYGMRTCARGDLGGRDYDMRRFQTFLVWFAQDCRIAPPSDGGAAAPASRPSPRFPRRRMRRSGAGGTGA